MMYKDTKEGICIKVTMETGVQRLDDDETQQFLFRQIAE